ncbi:SDR family NAD(P)-dependent oxidoreductase [Geomicrobium sp. JCM 19039]|uniref:SDR family NAD(P)-dependent oxidoreductase n=1 Tax=Geomicrobium sp. JCM 19039 TaxID=1460636 RepID=UPI00045F1996|nr:glucose 1-dehydrogenase [Geomicrobium sp. JCM 19039]GAK14119.1 3-oxoacyl-[acyl-carrier protein] reductase [Geomicrobium sp. JCM 19039]
MSEVAFITGAGRGIGREIAKTLANKGMKIVVTDISIDSAKETAELLNTEALPLACDVTSLEDVGEAVKKAADHFGKISILVNNAGWDKIEPFLKSEPDTWQKVISINLMGQIHTCKAVLPVMIDQGHGKVVNLASDSARVGSSGEAVYSAAKGGVVSFTKTLAREMARHKINVNCIAPGPSNPPLLAEISEYNDGIVKALEKAIPFRRLAEAEDIANAVAFFASQEAGYVTGQTLSVNGGLTMA